MRTTTSIRLKSLMDERGLKQVDILRLSEPFQKKLGIKISKSHLSQYVNGKSSPDQHKLYLLAQTLDVSEAWLMGYDVSEKNEAYNDDISLIYNELDKPRKKIVYEFAEDQLFKQRGTYPIFENVSIYGYTSAGTGEILEEYEEIDEIAYEGNAPKHDYALYVKGDSMLPLFSDGQIIFIKKSIEAYNNQIIIAYLNGESYVKKLVKTDDTVKLISLNKEYKDIIIKADDEFNVLGVVIL